MLLPSILDRTAPMVTILIRGTTGQMGLAATTLLLAIIKGQMGLAVIIQIVAMFALMVMTGSMHLRGIIVMTDPAACIHLMEIINDQMEQGDGISRMR
jgi:hypothetical protein